MTWQVRAQVVDIRSDLPRSGDTLWVDTNVWIWLTYSRTHPPHAPPYITYVAAMRKAGAQMIAGPINFSELAKHIEITELFAWQARTGRAQDTRELKYFRGQTAERQDVTDEIQACWTHVSTFAQLPASPIESTCVTTASVNLKAGDFLDGHDAVLVAEARKNGIATVLTDDGDYASVDGITLFTANGRVIGEARRVGKLVVR